MYNIEWIYKNAKVILNLSEKNISERSDSLSKLNFAIFLRESGDFVYGRQKSSLYRLPFSAFVKLVICK